MNAEICRNFLLVRTKFPDQLNSNGKYYFNDDQHFKEYCSGNNCSNDLEKVNAGCLYLFDTFFKDSSVFKSVANSNINIVEYIMIWLSYMLNLKNNEGSDSINFFYNTNINNDKYQKPITNVTEYKNYKDLIDKKKYFLDMDSNIISNFYEAFKLLCEMYTEFDENKKDCTGCSEKSSQFAKKYEELNKGSNINEDSPYYPLLSTLSNDYNNFKNKCNDTSSFPEIETRKFYGQFYEAVSSSSSIANKLIPILSIFGAIAIFLGISYKYSLFGFRKRDQKQKLREKLKK
ncbi:BIR protein [Plasmodium berghei]|uniref:BIR protein n=1 Tax=Plasmodium berghei TaxID=5821 RepID=A0A113RX89_PLABE|nr:BIR protein [Plasmodium berghei]